MAGQSTSSQCIYHYTARTCLTDPSDVAIEPLSEDALKHFKTYKYSSVDKSPISYYILRHYVRFLSP